MSRVLPELGPSPKPARFTARTEALTFCPTRGGDSNVRGNTSAGVVRASYTQHVTQKKADPTRQVMK